MAPIDMYKEVNTGTNLPAQIDIYASQGNAYKFHFIAKGGGSANKTYLYQQTKALLNPDSLMKFVNENIKYVQHDHATRHITTRLVLTRHGCACWQVARNCGMPALPFGDRHRRHIGRVDAQDRQAGQHQVPRHPAHRGYVGSLPSPSLLCAEWSRLTSVVVAPKLGNKHGRAFRDVELEKKILELAQKTRCEIASMITKTCV
jgi:hypothetical protein